MDRNLTARYLAAKKLTVKRREAYGCSDRNKLAKLLYIISKTYINHKLVHGRKLIVPGLAKVRGC